MINREKGETKASRKLIHDVPLPRGVQKCEWFLKMKPWLCDRDYWRLLRKVWFESDNLFDYIHELKECFEEPRMSKEINLMTDDEIVTLCSLMDEIKIYRMMNLSEYKSKQFGITWGANPDQVTFRFCPFGNNIVDGSCRCTIVETTVAKKDIAACFQGLTPDGSLHTELIYCKPIKKWNRLK